MKQLPILKRGLSFFENDKIEKLQMNFLRGGDGGDGGEGSIPPPPPPPNQGG